MVSALVRGLLVGVLVAAPIGPMALLAIRRTLDRGFADGLASGLGIATADGVYAAVAGFGLTVVSGPLLAHASAVQLGGGALIVALGLRGLLSGSEGAAAGAGDHGGLLAAYGSCLALTLANPPTLLSFAALIAALGVLASDARTAAAFASGVFLGSTAWWTALSGGVWRGRSALSPKLRTTVNRAASAGLAALGAVLALRAVQ